MASPFAFHQLHKALQAAANHDDPAVRQRAAKRADDWEATIVGMSTGNITVGSRVPVKDFPSWVTLKVAYGGFATGQAMAADLEADEYVAAKDLIDPAVVAASSGSRTQPDATIHSHVRGKLFSHYLSDAGLAELRTMLETGSYVARVPEDTALLVTAWLLQNNYSKAAGSILEATMPFATRLRFAPRAAPPLAERTPIGFVCRRTVDDARERLKIARVNRDLETMHTVLTVWNPITDRMLALWQARVGGPSRTNRFDEEPFDAAWLKEARDVLQAYDTAIKDHGPRSRHRQNVTWLADGTREIVQNGKMADRTNGRVRIAVTTMIQKRGAMDSPGFRMLREQQARVATLPSAQTVGNIVAQRLDGLYGADGLLDPTPYMIPITTQESQTHKVPEGHSLPKGLVSIVRSTLSAPLETLVQERLVPSAETYAKLLPQEVSRIVATSYTDGSLGRLMAANYAAFANRRSLLLLNYQHQVREEELPWVTAVQKYHVAGASPSSKALVKAAEAAIKYWPGTIVPNPFVAQLSNLAQAGAVNIDLTEEIAADIFMGDFTPKFTRAAKQAAAVVEGTIYAQYFNIDTGGLAAMAAKNPADKRSRERTPFDKMCEHRTSFKEGHARYTVRNGEVVEQSQVLTTHNLAAFVKLGVQVDWYAASEAAWRDCRRKLLAAASMSRSHGWVKNAAYAWRQAIFFLAMAEKHDASAVNRFVSAARADCQSATTTVARFDILLAGLEDATRGAVAQDFDRTPNGRIFFGWTRGAHWILKKDPEEAADAPVTSVT